MFRAFWLVIAAAVALWSLPAQAADVMFDGFTFGVWDSAAPGINDHTRLNLRADLGEDWSARVAITPRGPLRTFSYGEFTWKNPVKGIDAVTFGRTFPPFGRVWYDYIVDQVPVVYYSDIYWPLAAAETGVTIFGSSGRFNWSAGGYAGDPEFGTDFGPSSYLRGQYALSKQVSLGVSQRVSEVPVTGADVKYQNGRFLAIGELVTSEGVPQGLVLGEYKLGRSTFLDVQHEWLQTGTRWTVVPRWQIGRHLELKVGYQFGDKHTDHVFAQTVVRW